MFAEWNIWNWVLVNYHLKTYAWMPGYWAYLIFYRQLESHYWFIHGNVCKIFPVCNSSLTRSWWIWMCTCHQIFDFLSLKKEEESSSSSVANLSYIQASSLLMHIKLTTKMLKFPQLNPKFRTKIYWFLFWLLRNMYIGNFLDYLLIWC